MTLTNPKLKSKEDFNKDDILVEGVIKKRKEIVRISYLFLISILFILSWQARNILSMMLCVLGVVAAFLEKKQRVHKNGIDIVYNMQFKTYVDQWSWAIITSVHWEERKNNPLIAVHFGKGTMTRTFFIEKEDLKKIQFLVKTCNPKIHMGQVES